jgi:hypothetical protein
MEVLNILCFSFLKKLNSSARAEEDGGDLQVYEISKSFIIDAVLLVGTRS